MLTSANERDHAVFVQGRPTTHSGQIGPTLTECRETLFRKPSGMTRFSVSSMASAEL